jgi:hypothetical protein
VKNLVKIRTRIAVAGMFGFVLTVQDGVARWALAARTIYAGPLGIADTYAGLFLVPQVREDFMYFNVADIVFGTGVGPIVQELVYFRQVFTGAVARTVAGAS